MKNGKTVNTAIACRDMDVNIHATVCVHQDKLASIHKVAAMHSVPKIVISLKPQVADATRPPTSSAGKAPS
ncbi:hypothetical protein BGZ52_006000 [Haplosporangium bisporale]|nr:hypothetical protein BGZ52_006000 [Haplosporangium bisporale]KAF9205072.1 hypothetical protein BGZ59_000693 [Podila verticillata]